MAFLLDEENQNGLASPAPALGGGGPASSSVAPSAPAPASGSYTDLRAYLTGNQPAVQQMGANLATRIGNEATAATDAGPVYDGPNGKMSGSGGNLAPDGEGHRREALGMLDAAQGQSGRAALLQQQAGPGYTPGQSRLDAYLLGAGGMGPLNDARAKWGGLLPALTTMAATPAMDRVTAHGVAKPPPPPEPQKNPMDATSHLPANPDPMQNPMDGASHGQTPWGTLTDEERRRRGGY